MNKTFETPTAPELELRLAAGTIVVQTEDTDRTEVDLEPLDEAAEEVLPYVRTELRETGSRPRVLVEVPERRGLASFISRGPRFSLRVTCPHGSDAIVRSKSADFESRGRLGALDAASASGDVEAREVDGRTTVQTASGDVDLGEAGGPVSVQTVSGDISIRHAGGDVKASAVSGDIQLAEAGGAVEASTVSGDQRITAAGRGAVALESVSGDVQVGILRGVDVWLDVRSMSGDTTSELDAGEGPPPAEGQAIELRAQTVSGDIRIQRAAASV